MKRPGRLRRVMALGVAGLLVMCVVGAGLSALSNLTLPAGPTVLDQLTPLDKARLQETLQLKRSFGEAVWPGWGEADIPVLIWNAEYAFLVGYPNPPSDWERMENDDLAGQAYYRQPAHDPQNFAVRVGERWVASLATKWEADNFLMTQFRTMMPGPLKPIFPYRLLIQPTEVQLTGVLHESFHVYEVLTAPARFAEADNVYASDSAYWAVDAEMHPAWREEIGHLVEALTATEVEATIRETQAFLSSRDQRRQAYQLEVGLVNYEQQLEWLEGLAKYVELSLWRAAASDASYEPLPALTDDPDFKAYATFAQRWSMEIDQMQRQATLEGDVRFYYTGMAQATLLDGLMPDWKTRILAEPVSLDDLLREAVDPD